MLAIMVKLLRVMRLQLRMTLEVSGGRFRWCKGKESGWGVGGEYILGKEGRSRC